MYSQVFLVGRRLSEHLRFHLKLWGCIPWGQHSEFLWNSLVVVAPTRPLATGHHESVLWKSTQHTAELVAYHGVTPVSKQPCERQKACPAMDLRYCLQRMLQGWRSCASTTHFLGGCHWPDQTHQLCIRHAKHEPAGMKPRSRCSTTRNWRTRSLLSGWQLDRQNLHSSTWATQGGGFCPQSPKTSHDFSVHQGAEAQHTNLSAVTSQHCEVADFSNTSSLGRICVCTSIIDRKFGASMSSQI